MTAIDASATLSLAGLAGNNPLGFLAGLGVLDACAAEGLDARLSWTDDLTPTAVLTTAAGLDEVLEAVEADRVRFVGSSVLNGPPGHPLTDAKPGKEVLRRWAEVIGDEAEPPLTGGTPEQNLFAALVAEGATDTTANRNAKPTHLHFSAGQQQFLRLAKDLAQAVTRSQLSEAMTGPWRPDPAAKTFGWNAGGARVYAFRASDPAGEKRPGYPGPDWLAFRGLVALPVVARAGRDGFRLVTTACETGWKVSSFRWPLWSSPLRTDEVRSLIGSVIPQPPNRVDPLNLGELQARGVTRVFRSPISRTDQGGYGSFAGADVELDTSSAGTSP